MTLCDTGPLFALVDASQKQQNVRCKAVLPRLSLPLLTTWPCFTEAMHLAYRAGGWPMQRLLWQYVLDDQLLLHNLSAFEKSRLPALMEQYRDTPMDLADASLVAVAETQNMRRVFTLDSDFYVYRIDKDAFEVVP